MTIDIERMSQFLAEEARDPNFYPKLITMAGGAMVIITAVKIAFAQLGERWEKNLNKSIDNCGKND